MYKLSFSDIEDLAMLENIVDEIYTNYNILYSLEKENKKESEEYLRLVKRIKDLKILEESIYERLTTSVEQIEAIKEYLGNKADLNPYYLNISVIKNKEKLKYSRIINNFNFAKLDFYLNNPAPKHQKEELGKSEFIDRINLYFASVNNYVLLDILNLVNAMFENTGDCWPKYCISFLNKNIECDLVENNFYINKNPYLVNKIPDKIFSDILDESLDMDIRLEVLAKTFESMLNSILSFDDYKLTDPKLALQLDFDANFLRAVLILLEEPSKTACLNLIQNIALNLSETRCYYRAQGALENVIKSQENDKLIPQIISFNL